MTSEAELQRCREFFDNQTRVLAELKEALKAEPVVRMRWDRIAISHGDWRCRTPGAPHPHGLSDTMVRVEVGLVEHGTALRLTTLTFDYPEDELDDIPQRVTDGVRAYIEKERMSLREEVAEALEGLPYNDIRVFRDVLLHGEKAIQVRVDARIEAHPFDPSDPEEDDRPADTCRQCDVLFGDHSQQRMVEGIFTTAQKAAFGGVDFAQQKDIPALMTAKVRAVLAGTAEEVRA